ncbi:Protein CBG11792 [Caenorhabditis briggsae]|uniref:Protein CBG11792 n=1 Tax=Caenorhabditis briggsae TaxID=6238 RepID=A8XE23_CAEBR|nr:Protein CBG11792 [Caenorhabditis briggsae]CAP30893.2 Protein CBG11792 [Caenorhabditis briggsae]
MLMWHDYEVNIGNNFLFLRECSDLRDAEKFNSDSSMVESKVNRVDAEKHEVRRGCGKSCQRDPATSTSFINRLNPICVERQQNVHERQETLLSSEQKSTGQRESEKEKDCWTIKMY